MSDRKEIDFNKRLEQLTSRHIAKALTHLKQIKTPDCAIDSVRREFWFLCDDIKIAVNDGQSNYTTEDEEHETIHGNR